MLFKRLRTFCSVQCQGRRTTTTRCTGIVEEKTFNGIKLIRWIRNSSLAGVFLKSRQRLREYFIWNAVEYAQSNRSHRQPLNVTVRLGFASDNSMTLFLFTIFCLSDLNGKNYQILFRRKSAMSCLLCLSIECDEHLIDITSAESRQNNVATVLHTHFRFCFAVSAMTSHW